MNKTRRVQIEQIMNALSTLSSRLEEIEGKEHCSCLTEFLHWLFQFDNSQFFQSLFFRNSSLIPARAFHPSFRYFSTSSSALSALMNIGTFDIPVAR